MASRTRAPRSFYSGISADRIVPIPIENNITRDDFKDFIFGASSSSYQIEGGSAEGGRGFSVWDSYCLANPENIDDRSDGTMACNSYKVYKDDVKILKKTGFDTYRFSVSWPRILPGGRICAGINREGINYYNNLIDELLAAGIEPYVTLFHWDTPLALQDSYCGFLDEKIVGYVNASFPPGRGAKQAQAPQGPSPQLGYKHSYKAFSATDGNPGTEPYIVAHNFILAHASVVHLYRTEFQELQRGQIGIVNNINWYEPLDPHSKADQDAARRAVDFMFGWFVAPIVTGDYPESMRKNVGNRLPIFNEEQTKLIKGSYDFLGVNYYTTYYAQHSTTPINPHIPNYDTDKQYIQLHARGGKDIGARGGSSWLYIVPEGIYEALKFMQAEYGNPLIYITENGVDTLNDIKLSTRDVLKDQIRVDYHRDHLLEVKRAIDELKVNVRGYFIWSLCDNYEWTEGYTVRFGIFYIDFKDGRCSRYPKASALWWRRFLKQSDESILWKREPHKITENDNASSKKRRI